MVKPVVAVLLLCAICPAQQSTSSREPPAAPHARASEQKSSPQKAPAKAVAPEPLPLYDVLLTANPDVSTILPDQFEAVAEGCDGSGNPYFSISRNDEMEVAALTPKGVVSSTARKVTDVSSVTFVKPFVAPSEIYVLAIWVDSSAEKATESDPIKDFIVEGEGEGHFYIVRFDLDGSYRRALKLDFEFLPMQFAAFENGGFLVGGLDKSRAAHVAMLDSSGQLLNYLRLPKDVAENPNATSKFFAKSGVDNRKVSPEEIAVFASASRYKENVLFRRAADPSRVYEVRNTGEVRMVTVKDARASGLDDMLQSDEDWFAFAKQDELYEISSSTGKLLGHYRLKNNIQRKDQIVSVHEGEVIGTRYTKGNKIEQRDQLACVYQGKFIGIRQTKGKLMLLTGVAEPAEQDATPATDQH